MTDSSDLPPIPSKRYFTIGEVSELCGVKSHVLRYWEQEFSQLRPMKRRGNRRYYQHHEVLLIRRIRELLYDQGFTIHGARSRLTQGEVEQTHADASGSAPQPAPIPMGRRFSDRQHAATPRHLPGGEPEVWPVAMQDDLRSQLLAIQSLLSFD